MIFLILCKISDNLLRTITRGSIRYSIAATMLCFAISGVFADEATKNIEDKTIKIAFTIPLEGDNFDPIRINYTSHREICFQLFTPLMLRSRNGDFLPGSAKK